ncbi:SGNH hydrolase-type esterase domain-containing protein [Apiospora arundinis]|uniref:SGNH hydrolase-type esterase domain-containing protein n=1 Tax=Apiospora arundinis TaxID=335852 RepID=A0ABR2ISD4_9PEZI
MFKMAGIAEKVLSVPLLNMLLARRRFLIIFGLTTLLLMLMFSGAGNVDMTRLSVSGANPEGAPGTRPKPVPPPVNPDVPVPAPVEQPAPAAAAPPENVPQPKEPQHEPETPNPKPVEPHPEATPKTPEQPNNSKPHPLPVASPRPFISYQDYKRPGYDLPLTRAIPLRIMAMGSPAAFDHSASDDGNADNDNGFRLLLRERLTELGHKVNYVGDGTRGNMMDAEVVAAAPDKPPTVAALHELAGKVVPGSKPNVYIVSTGAEDAFKHLDVPRFYVRLDAFVRYLLDASHRSTVVLTTLPLPHDGGEQNGVREETVRINEQIRRLVTIHQKESQPVVLAELQGPDAAPPTPMNGGGGEHGKAAATAAAESAALKIFDALVEADAKGYLQAPEQVEGIPDDGDWNARTTSEAFRQWEADKAKYYAQQKQNNEDEISRMEAELKKIKGGGGEGGVGGGVARTPST